jgi:hypothetical protein
MEWRGFGRTQPYRYSGTLGGRYNQRDKGTLGNVMCHVCEGSVLLEEGAKISACF